MINRILNIIRTIAISPEALLLALNGFLYVYFPVIYSKVGQWYLRDANLTTGVLPITGILIYSAAQAKSILFPGDTSKKLNGWPDFFKLKDRVIIGLIFSSTAVLVSFFMLVFKDELPATYAGLIFLASLSVATSCLASMFLAQLSIKVLLDHN